MKHSGKSIGMMVGALLLVGASVAGAAQTAEQKCLAKRVSAWSKYESCVAKIMGAIYAGAPLDAGAQEKLAKCRTKFAGTWPKLAALEGSATCSGLPRFVDDGNGTIRDNLSGLTWNKQGDNAGEPWDKDSIYDWSSGAPYGSDGSAFDYLLFHTNGSMIGGNRDWRVPSIAELMSIVLAGPLPCASSPCIEPAFNTGCMPNCFFSSACSCTVAFPYWTGVTVPGSTNQAYAVDFADGELFNGFKTLDRNTRVVRGGLN